MPTIEIKKIRVSSRQRNQPDEDAIEENGTAVYRGFEQLGRYLQSLGYEPFECASEDEARGKIDELLPRFLGRIEQTPPSFSAVHVEGQRAYRLARQGRQVAI
jgi:hypothetical protein